MSIIDLPATIQAATDKPARVSILAYSGGVVNPSGWRNLIVDLSGMKLPPSVVLLADHENVIDAVAGHGTATIRGGKLFVEGTIVRGSKAGDSILNLAKGGVQLQASVGCEAMETKQIRSGDTIQVNGQTFTAPRDGLTVATESLLREVTITPLGADSTTTVSVAAKQTDKGLITMTAVPSFSDDSHIQGTTPAIAVSPSAAADITAAAESLELKTNSFGEYVKLAERRALSGEIDNDAYRAELASIEARDAEVHKIRTSRTQAGTIRTTNTRGGIVGRETIEASLLLRAGKQSIAERHYGEQVLDSTRAIRGMSFVDICATCARIDGRDTSGMSRNEMIKAGFSTTALPTALSNVTGKTLFETYRESTRNWRGFAKVLPAADFKPQVGVRPSFVGQLEEVGGTGEVKHGSLAESTYNWSIGTFAKQMSLTRTSVINDDLGIIDQTAPNLGKMAARSLNDLVWQAVMDNAGSFFSSGNANLLEAGSTFGPTALANAVSAMRKQRDAQNNDIDIMPRVLAVPPELENLARATLTSEQIQAVEGDPMGNALKGIAELVIESRLSNTAKFTNADTAAWFLFGDPMDAPVVVGFLDGMESPTIEFFGLDHDVNTLGIAWRIYHDFGCALGDYRAAVKATGASE